MPFVTRLRILYRAAQQFGANGGAQMGAALAYYALFSTAPLLILAVTIAGLLFGETAAQERVRAHLNDVVGERGADEVMMLMNQAMRPSTGWLAAVVGIVTLVFGALGAFLHVRRCLLVIWRLENVAPSGLIGTLFNYLLAIVMVFTVALLLLFSLAVSTALPILIDFWEETLPGTHTIWRWAEAGVSLLLLTLFFALVYRFMSGRRIPWKYVLYGSMVSALLFTVGKTVIGLYLAYSSTASAYGAAASLVVLLVWVYYSAQIFFFGAELIQARRTRAEWMT